MGNVDAMKEKLTKGVVDNVLLEWMLAIELHEKKVIQAIIPVFETKEMYFGSEKDKIMNDLKGKTSVETNRKCAEFMELLKLTKNDKTMARTVGDVYETLCKFQAISLDKFKSRELH